MDGIKNHLLSSLLLIIGSSAFVVRLRFKESFDIYLSEQENFND